MTTIPQIARRGSTAFLSIILLGAILLPSASAAFQHLQEGMTPPTFEGSDVRTGEQVSSAQVPSDGILLVTFWATWSPRSLELLADLNALSARLESSPLRIIAVNVEGMELDGEASIRIHRQVEDLGLSFPVVLDPDLEIFDQFGVIAVPSTALIDADGVLRYGPAGYSAVVRDRMVDSTEVLLGLRDREDAPALRDGYRPDPRAGRYYHLALQLLRQGIVERALANLDEAEAIDPRFSAPHNLRGEIHLQLDQPGQAEQSFRRAVELDSSSVAAWAGWGRCLLLTTGATEATEKLAHAIELDPSYTPAILDLATCRAQEKDPRAALELVNQAIELNPMNPSAYHRGGRLLRDLGRLGEAVASYRRALELTYPGP